MSKYKLSEPVKGSPDISAEMLNQLDYSDEALLDLIIQHRFLFYKRHSAKVLLKSFAKQVRETAQPKGVDPHMDGDGLNESVSVYITLFLQHPVDFIKKHLIHALDDYRKEVEFEVHRFMYAKLLFQMSRHNEEFELTDNQAEFVGSHYKLQGL